MPKRRADNEGSIFFHKGSGRWRAELFLDWDRTVHPPKKVVWGEYAPRDNNTREALAVPLATAIANKEQLRRRALEARRAGARADMTTQEFLAHWSTTIAPGRVGPETLRGYKKALGRALPLIGRIPLRQLDGADLDRCYAALLQRGPKGKPLARSTVQQTHAVLHLALGTARRRLGRNPADDAVAVPRPARRVMTTLTEEQLGALFDGTRGHRLGPLWIVLGTIGLRISEALGLLWTDVRLERDPDTGEATGGRITVQRKLQRQPLDEDELEEGGPKTALRTGTTKTATSRRTIKLTPIAAVALAEQLERQTVARLTRKRWTQTGHVFANTVGKPLELSEVHYQLQRALERTGLQRQLDPVLAANGQPHLRVHDLRHTCATLLLLRGTNVKYVSELLGHASVKVTLEIYFHVIDRTSSVASDEMAKMFPVRPRPDGPAQR